MSEKGKGEVKNLTAAMLTKAVIIVRIQRAKKNHKTHQYVSS
jgi:hypothetical protein